MTAVGAELLIDLSALVHNWRQIALVARPGRSAAVVKADGYGLGALRVSQALIAAGCGTLFVATADEALALRAAGIAAGLFVFEGARAESAEALAAANVAPVLNDAAQCDRWLKLMQRLQRPLTSALNVDTGMARLGFAVADLLRWAERRDRVQLLAPQFLMTHLACADDPQHPLNAVQLARFARCREALPTLPVSIGNSAGALSDGLASSDPSATGSYDRPATRGDLVRPGIALYGGNPFVDRRAVPLREVVQLRAPVLQVRELPDNERVGYGATATTHGTTRVATVGLGYADGYLRSLSNVGRALVAGIEVPVLGRVSMDLVMVDVTALPAPVPPGTWVTFLGGGIGLEQTAAAAGTISYELLVRMGPRIARRYSNTERGADG